MRKLNYLRTAAKYARLKFSFLSQREPWPHGLSGATGMGKGSFPGSQRPPAVSHRMASEADSATPLGCGSPRAGALAQAPEPVQLPVAPGSEWTSWGTSCLGKAIGLAWPGLWIVGPGVGPGQMGALLVMTPTREARPL